MIALEVGQTVEIDDVFGQTKRGEVTASTEVAVFVKIERMTFSLAPWRVKPIACPVHGLGCEAWS